MRTNVELDEEIMKQAYSVSGFNVKKELADQALNKEFVQNRTRKDLTDLRGNVKFADDYDYKTARGTKD